MIPYYILIGLLLFFIFREDTLHTKEQKQKNLICALIPVFFMLAFKGEEIGADTVSYIRHFEYSTDWLGNEMGGYERIEIGFTYFLFLLHHVSDNALVLFVSTSLLLCIALYFFIKENSRNWTLTLFFFITMGFFQFALSGVRQTMAITILLFSFHFIKEKRWLFVAAGCALAYFFHKSSVVFALAVVISNIEMTGKRLLLWGTIMLASLFAIEKILLFIGGMMSYDYGIEETGNGYIFFAIMLVITYFSYRFKDKLLAINDNNSRIFNINLLAFLMWIVRLFSRTAERMSLYFMPYTYIMLSELIEAQPKSNKSLVKGAVIIICIVLFLYRMQGEAFNPYTFCFK